MEKINKIIKENNLVIPKKEDTKKYDKDGNLIWRKSPRGNIWEYRYKDGNLIWEKDPDGDVYEYRYKDGNLIWKKYPNGDVYEYRWKNGNKVWENVSGWKRILV